MLCMTSPAQCQCSESGLGTRSPRGPAACTEESQAWREGPRPLYVAALVAKWEGFPQTKLLAAAVRLGYLSRDEAAALVGGIMDAVAAGFQDLQERQETFKNF